MRTNCIRGQRTSQCKPDSVQLSRVSSPKAEGSSNKKSKKRKSPKKKPTSPPRTPPKEVAALEKTQAPQSNRYGERRTQWKNSNLQPSGGAIRKELRCTNCKQQGHWTTNCPTIECFKCHKKGHMARACPESEDNVERKDIACQVCGQRGVTVPECGRCSYLFDRSGNEQVEARGYANQQTQPSGGYLCQLCYRSIEKLVESTWNVRRFCQSRWSWAWISVDDGESIYPWPKSVAFRGRAMAQFRQIERGKVNAMRHCGRVCWYHSVWRRKGNIESKIKRLIPDVPPKLGHTDKIVHRIELVEGAKPVCHRTRRMTPKMEKIAHECLQKMKEEGIIEPAKSEWNSAPVLRASPPPIHDYPTPRNVKQVRRLLGMFLRGLRCTHRRTRWTGRSPFSPAITAGNGRAWRGNNERTPTEEELPVSVDRPAALARASVLHRRARDVARTEEESRCWRRRHGQCWSSWWRPVNRWKNGTARHSRRFFRGSPEEEVLLLEEGEATATLRRSGETTEESARVPTPPLAPVQEPSALPLPPPVQQVSYVAGLHGLVFQPFAVQQQRLPQTEYPLDGQTTAPASPPGALPRAATTSSATSTATATTSARGSPRGGSTSKPGGGS
ncbi:unnamed protein product [Trichogramma brassicae]|uniref:CCHC-type domain-containing protein n=1 Tax=Trichogramma brassicae TaxID=86971 RepID=A0A6H5IDP2_9HYME|nr:unnamed protein product [Trichogramma brassicae]